MRFMIIVWVGTQSNELDWIDKFIKEYITKIEPDKRQYVFAYNKALLEFSKNNYTEALEILVKADLSKMLFIKLQQNN